MTRTPIVAGNWKMNKTPPESLQFVRDLLPKIETFGNIEKLVAPTYLSLTAVASALQGSPVKVAAQNGHWEASGAYTSEVSAAMLRDYVSYIIVGHSETRAYLNETDESVNRKAKAVLANGLGVIIAVGESLEQNDAGQTESFVSGQVRAALDGVPGADMAKVVIAYEPIWAIGTGRSASGVLANAIIKSAVRDSISDMYGQTVAEAARIQYGGSVKPSNMDEFMSQPDIDGALVGGASLDVNDFASLIEIASRVKGS
ncbi:MAG: triose-phosphate isomerase [Chloroflexi bacterium]|nr:triose-phosphate isomerase [Chloroflexota bacterium]